MLVKQVNRVNPVFLPENPCIFFSDHEENMRILDIARCPQWYFNLQSSLIDNGSKPSILQKNPLNISEWLWARQKRGYLVKHDALERIRKCVG